MEESLIVVRSDEATGGDGRFSVWSAPGEAEAQIRRLVECGTPAESIRVYRVRPLRPLRPLVERAPARLRA